MNVLKPWSTKPSLRRFTPIYKYTMNQVPHPTNLFTNEECFNIYKLKRFLLIDVESNPISIGTRILGIKNNEKSGREFPWHIQISIYT